MATPNAKEEARARKVVLEARSHGIPVDIADIAHALAEAREEHEKELTGLKLAAGLQLAEAAADAVFDFLNWLEPQHIELIKVTSPAGGHAVAPGELFESWKKEQGR
jgi:hypothetical protein